MIRTESVEIFSGFLNECRILTHEEVAPLGACGVLFRLFAGYSSLLLLLLRGFVGATHMRDARFINRANQRVMQTVNVKQKEAVRETGI